MKVIRKPGNWMNFILIVLQPHLCVLGRRISIVYDCEEISQSKETLCLIQKMYFTPWVFHLPYFLLFILLLAFTSDQKYIQVTMSWLDYSGSLHELRTVMLTMLPAIIFLKLIQLPSALGLGLEFVLKCISVMVRIHFIAAPDLHQSPLQT